jgi:aldose 1-epimerase
MIEVDTDVGRLAEFVLENAHGDRVTLLNYGARIRSIRLRLRGGERELVSGYASIDEYLDDRYYVGATVGRVANRIRGAQFELHGHTHRLAANQGVHQLHGGPDGFDRRYWQALPGANARAVEFALRSADGDQGYPGQLDARVHFSWSDARELRIGFAARSDRTTHVNLVSHAYFNLDGAAGGDVRDHRICIRAGRLTVVDADALPTGELRELAGTGLDLRAPRRIRELLESGDPLVELMSGADFNYVLDGEPVAAQLWSSSGDLRMDLETSYPGLQFYTAQHFGAPFRRFGGVCLEPQFFPDAPNQARVNGTRLEAGQRYAESASFRFVELP